MKVLFWYCEKMRWTPTSKTLDDAPDGESGEATAAVAAWIHVEPDDEDRAGKVVTKLVKNCKWLAGKWNTKTIVLHSFSHLAAERAKPQLALTLLERARERLEGVDYDVITTPWGHFNDLELNAPGHALARVFKEL